MGCAGAVYSVVYNYTLHSCTHYTNTCKWSPIHLFQCEPRKKLKARRHFSLIEPREKEPDNPALNKCLFAFYFNLRSCYEFEYSLHCLFYKFYNQTVYQLIYIYIIIHGHYKISRVILYFNNIYHRPILCFLCVCVAVM